MADREYNLHATYLARGITLERTAEKRSDNLIGRRREFLTYLLGPRQFLFAFSFGAVVFANVSRETQTEIRRSFNRFLTNPVRKRYEESYVLQEKPGAFSVADNAAELPAVAIEEVEVAARVLAQSVALEHIEDLTDEILGNIESMNAEVERSGKFLSNVRPILKLAAQNSNIIQFVISKLSLLDKPDIVWEREKLDAFFSQLADVFELRSRFRNIEYKIGFARDNSEFALTVLAAQRGNFLEFVIVVLIVVEILLLFVV